MRGLVVELGVQSLAGRKLARADRQVAARLQVAGDSVGHLGWETNYDKCRGPRINETDHLAL